MNAAVSQFATTGIVAVTESMPTAGAISYWRLSEKTDYAALVAAWSKRGLDAKLLPSVTSEKVALRRAVQELSTGRSLVRPLEKREGWALVAERAHDSTLDYSVALTVKPGASGLVFEPLQHPSVPVVLAAYVQAIGTLTQQDVSGWLVDLVRAVDAVALRDSGGVYFVPNHALPLWESMVSAIRECSDHKVFAIPAMKADDTLASVLDAVIAEGEADIAKMDAELQSGKLGERALDSRLAATVAMQKKIERYESALGIKLDSLREKRDAVQARVSIAILSAASPMVVS